MKKMVGTLVVAAVVLSIAAPACHASSAGGAEGFFTGCCFGLRAGADYNDRGTGDRDFLPWFLVGVCLGPRTQIDYANGKDFHWREILRVIPYVNIVAAIWDGADGAAGKGRKDLQDAYGLQYY